ncbi:MAG: transcriptional repressor [Erysipelotrichaceae bacterium]|nr:transcriptional repressor [Erysipelotrichaceae bacterium]
MNSADKHLKAEEVYEELQQFYPKVSLATVYNNLNKLCEDKLIRRVSIEGYSDRYDRIVKHDHLVCEKCGKLMDISFLDLSSSLKAQLSEQFLYYDLKVFYVCPDCRAKFNSHH